MIFVIIATCSCLLLFPNVAGQACCTCWMRGFLYAFIILLTFLREVGFNLLLAVYVFKVDLFQPLIPVPTDGKQLSFSLQ